MAQKRRTRVKLHLGVDVLSHDVVAAEVTTSSVGDTEVLPTMLRPLRRKNEVISGDGAYDSKQRYSEVAKKKAQPIIPPRRNDGFWEDGHP